MSGVVLRLQMLTPGCQSRRQQAALGAHPAAKVGVRAVGLVEPVLPLHHHPQVLVVQDEHLGRQLVDGHSRQLLQTWRRLHVGADSAVTLGM